MWKPLQPTFRLTRKHVGFWYRGGAGLWFFRVFRQLLLGVKRFLYLFQSGLYVLFRLFSYVKMRLVQ